MYQCNKMELEKEINQKKFRSPEHKLAVNIIYTFNWLNEFQVKILKPFDITLQQFNVLRILRGQYPQPANIKLIRERMLDKMSDASRIVEKLRIKQFIERKTCTDDRRACDVIITQKGLNLLEKVDSDEDAINKIFSTLSQQEIDQVNLLLDKLRG
jgi:DNA-binding MarR family transcriptional regulator